MKKRQNQYIKQVLKHWCCVRKIKPSNNLIENESTFYTKKSPSEDWRTEDWRTLDVTTPISVGSEKKGWCHGAIFLGAI